MKRIINRKKYRSKCPSCDCEFEYEKSDTFSFKNMGVMVTCPNCGSYIIHKDSVSSNLTTERM